MEKTEHEWREAVDGFLAGVDYKTWLEKKLEQARAELERVRAAAEFFKAYTDVSGEELGQWRLYAKKRWGEMWRPLDIDSAFAEAEAALQAGAGAGEEQA